MNSRIRKKILQKKQSSASRKAIDIARIRRHLARLDAAEAGPDYTRYIRSAAWREKREAAFAHHGRRCASCGVQKDLHVHHRHYRTLSREQMEDLIVCCKKCHFKLHLPEPEAERNRADADVRKPG